MICDIWRKKIIIILKPYRKKGKIKEGEINASFITFNQYTISLRQTKCPAYLFVINYQSSSYALR
jgi:hypothetical protein